MLVKMRIDANQNLIGVPAPTWLLVALLFVGCGRESPPRDTASTQSAAMSDLTRDSVPESSPPPAAPAATVTPEEMRQAALEGQSSTVATAIEQGADVNAADAEGRTALQLAAFDGHTDVVQQLLGHDAQVDHRDQAGRTALMYAASGPNVATVNVLLEANADPNVVDKVENFTALMFAAAEGQLEVVDALLKRGADTTLTDVDGDTARDFATQNGHQAVVERLSQ